ncbi:MAG: hypothetical protein RDU83_00230 [bacterium]|nr:hypothetical protein [bacterium]
MPAVLRVVIALLLVVVVPTQALAAPMAAQAGELTRLLEWLRRLQGFLDELERWRMLLIEQIDAWQATVLEPLAPLYQIGDLAEAIRQQLARLPLRFQGTLRALLAKLQALPAPAPGSPGWIYRRYAEQNPAIREKARQLVASEVMAAATTTETRAMAEMSGDLARELVTDATLPLAALDAVAAAQALANAATNIPSTRAGIQMLIAAMAAQMQQHAAYTQGLANRLQGLSQQEALSARELHALSWALNHQIIRAEKDREERLAGDLVAISFTSEIVGHTYSQGAAPFATLLRRPEGPEHALRLVRWRR